MRLFLREKAAWPNCAGLDKIKGAVMAFCVILTIDKITVKLKET